MINKDDGRVLPPESRNLIRLGKERLSKTRNQDELNRIRKKRLQTHSQVIRHGHDKNAPPLTILLLMDREGARNVMARRINELGFHAVEASDLKEGLLSLSQHGADIIFIDFETTQEQGLILAKGLKAHERTSKIPIIYCGPSRDEQEKQKAQVIGVEKYLERPYIMQHLMDCIKEICEKENLLKETMEKPSPPLPPKEEE